jgi:hypothetical protein
LVSGTAAALASMRRVCIDFTMGININFKCSKNILKMQELNGYAGRNTAGYKNNQFTGFARPACIVIRESCG